MPGVGGVGAAAGRDPVLSILVVSYNTAAMTVAALRSVAAETRTVPYEIIVVDNNSSDGSPDAIAKCGVPLQLIARKQNLGFARANNLAAEMARGEHILLLNPDTLVTNGAIDRLFQFARANPAAGIWGGRTVFADGSLNASCCWRAMDPWNLFCRTTGLTGLLPSNAWFDAEAYGGWQRDSVRPVDIVSGAFFMIRRDLWQKLGGFDESFFMYGEEADLCLRARKLGVRPLFTPSAEIVHYGGASEKTRAAKMVKLLAAKASLIERHWPRVTRPLGRKLLELWPLSRSWALFMAGYAMKNEDWRQRARVWKDIHDQRTTWRKGYESAETGAPEVVADSATLRQGYVASGQHVRRYPIIWANGAALNPVSGE